MRLKYVLLVCVLSLATVLGGCGTTPSIKPSEDVQETTDEKVSQKDTQAERKEDESKEELKAKALLAYQEILKAAPAIEGEHEELDDLSFGYDENKEMFGEHYDWFGLSDISQDGVPELFAFTIINRKWVPVSVYTYADGKAVLVDTLDQCSTANGTYSTYTCRESHLHSVWRGNPIGEEEVEENSAYVLEGTTLTPVDCTIDEEEDTFKLYDNVAENVDAITQ